MKVARIISKTVKVLLLALLAIVLVPAAVIIILYSPWGQEGIRTQVLPWLSESGIDISLDSFVLRYPMDIELGGLRMAMPGGLGIQADTARVQVALLPLLSGTAQLEDSRLAGGRMVMGGPDSAMYMTMDARELLLRSASLRFTDMAISINDGDLRGAVVDMTLNPDTTTAAPADTTAPSDMTVAIRRLGVTDLTYRMRMLPVIDSLGAHIARGELHDGHIDLKGQTINLETFAGTGLNAAYIAPDSATIAATPVVPVDTTTTTAPWTIQIGKIDFNRSAALYTTRGVRPLPGLDFGYIQVDSVDLTVSEFYNCASTVRLPVRIGGIERCGVRLDASGALDISEQGLDFKDFNISTPAGTELSAQAFMGMGDMTTDPSVSLRLKARGGLAVSDLKLMFPAFLPYLSGMPARGSVYAEADINGTAGRLDINNLSLAVNGMARLQARGNIGGAFAADINALNGDIALRGAIIDINSLKSSLFDPATAKLINIPLTMLDGNVRMRSGNIAGNLTARTSGGDISLDADWHSRAEDYKVDLRAAQFPVNAFMPSLGVGSITADITADGHGYNPFTPDMRLTAKLDVRQAVYQGYDYTGISADVDIADGNATVAARSVNPNARFTLDAKGNLAGDTYTWTAALDGDYINLKALGFSPEPATVEASLSADASYTPKTNTIAADVRLHGLNYKTEAGGISVDNVTARLNANDSVTNLMLHNRDLYAYMSSDRSLQRLAEGFAATAAVLDTLTAEKKISVSRLQQVMPPFLLDINGGSNNVLTDILADSRTSMQSMHLTVSNDSLLNLDAGILGLTTGTTRLDTVTLRLGQHGDTIGMAAAIDNQPGTFDEWAHVRLNGFIADNRLMMQVRQRNIQDKEGYFVGLRAELTDSAVTAHFDPVDPVIAYKPWTVNDDNFITYRFAHSHIDANLHAHGAGSSLAIYTNHAEGHDGEQEALNVELEDIHLSDWLSLNPFAPPVKGDLTARMRLGRDGSDITGTGDVALTDFFYDRQRVGDIGATFDVDTDLGGRIRATADVTVDSVKTITVSGALNDSTAGSPLALDFSMIHFPLSTVNPFLPSTVGRLSGTLNGKMDIGGTAGEPTFDGWLQFDKTAIKATIMGTSYAFSDRRIPVEANVVRLDSFTVSGVNDNPLFLNGTVDLHNMSNPAVNLRLNASNMQICNTSRAPKGADVYGRGFIDFDATVRSNMEFMRVNANLGILPGTNITYVMPEAVNTITNYSNDDMVKFVNFADTLAVSAADSIVESSMALMLDATLNVQNGSTINVDLSSNGNDKVRIQADGTVEMTMAPFSEPRVTGRLNINKGFVRYTPPLMSEKLFNFEGGSYVAFNGEMMNPVLNVHAVDVLKANVTQSGQNSRLVNFDVSLAVTGTLENMNVAFDLSTDDDITVANELQTMSAEQRANQAMNMLLYNVYTGPGTSASSNLSGNPLYSFLASQLNTWAANNIRGVDISFGIDQYDRTRNGDTRQTTSYSYQVSKSLFNDRFKIVVGGNYSTDANADENFSQNLINDISFDYYLNRAQTMYVRLFRHTGFESILEGEITQTGVGFVYKRKLATLRSLFRRRHRREQAPQQPAPQQPVPDSVQAADPASKTEDR